MIRFRCWFCSRKYAVADARAGERLTCTCDRRLRVPRRDGGNSRSRTPGDWLAEVVVYGTAGGLLGLGLGFLLLGRTPLFRRSPDVIVGLAVGGFVLGTLFGEAGINWIGRHIRDRDGTA